MRFHSTQLSLLAEAALGIEWSVTETRSHSRQGEEPVSGYVGPKSDQLLTEGAAGPLK
jgi:hypothetical protein